MPLAGLTASQLLDEALIDGARTLLVNGPLGAGGRSIVALAVHAGGGVIGVVRPEQTDEQLALGATHAAHRGDFTAAVHAHDENGVAAAVDLVGGATARATLAAVRDGGRYATAVPSYIDPGGPFETERGITVHVHTVRADTARLGELLALAAGEALPTRVMQSYPLHEAADAHRRQAAGGLTGRVVLIP